MLKPKGELMNLIRESRLWFAVLGFAIALTACSGTDDGTDLPPGPCYTIDELHQTSSSVDDSTAAKGAFLEYLTHLDDTDGYPFWDLTHIEYQGSTGREVYNGRTYWGIMARVVREGGEPSNDNRWFRVRDDGMVVSMLGCI